MLQGIRIPATRQAITNRALDKTAAAIIGAFGKLLLAVASHNSNAPIADQLHCLFWRCGIGNDIACADDIASRDAEALSLDAHRDSCLQVGIGAAKNEQRSVVVNH